MDNFYSDKYNLDNYKKTSVNRERPRSEIRAARKARVESEKPKKIKRSKTVYSPPRHTEKIIYKAPKPPKKKPSKAKKLVTVLVVLLIVGALTAAACVVGYNIYRENKKKQPFKFSEGVKISGINIGKLSMEQAKAKLEKNRLKAVDEVKLTIKANDTSKTYSKADFNYIFDYDTPLQEAKIYSLKEQDIYDPPKGEKQEDSGELKLPKLKLTYVYDKKSSAALAKKVAKKIDCKPVNAKVSKFHPFSDNRFEYKAGSYGYDLDEADLASKITKFMTSGKRKNTITASVEELIPEITTADLQKNIIGLSTATSTSYNTQNGNINMATALKACNGSIIEPGATWSFNKCTGDSNDPANGYKKATVITDRKLSEGYGGGICQASTTIFKAAALANMTITERYNHYWASGYAFAGEDATIGYPDIDLKLTNPTSYQMFIECQMNGTELLCNIYGVQDEYYDNVKIYSKNYDIVKKKSFSTHLYRVLYLNGEKISEETICDSFYSLTDKHVVQTEDKGTFRTMVDGTTKVEVEPKKKKKTSN